MECVHFESLHRNECGHIIGSLGWATVLSGKRYFIHPFAASKQTQLIDKLFVKCGFAVGHKKKNVRKTDLNNNKYFPVFKY